MTHLLRLLILFPILKLSAKEITIEPQSLPSPIKISLPENFNPTKKHPALFFYHGAGGSPSTELMRNQAGTDDWIIVGMTYTQGKTFTLSPQHLNAERKAYHEVRQHVISQYHADPKNIYLAGFSLGGWFTDLMLQSEPTLSGGIIIGAGHAHTAPKPLAKYTFSKPVHIATGRKDPNYIFALKAYLHHRKLGGDLSIEVWPDLAHAYPRSGTDSMRQWLKLRLVPEKDLITTAEKELAHALGEADSLAPLAQWDRLREIKAMPYFKLTSPSWQSNFQNSLTALEATPSIASEAFLYKEHRRLHHHEITKRNASVLRQVNASYQQLSRKFPETRQAKLMEDDFKRTEKILKQITIIPSEKKATQVPSGPISRPQIPRSPLRR